MVNMHPAVIVGVVVEVITLQDGLYSKTKFLKAEKIFKIILRHPFSKHHSNKLNIAKVFPSAES